MFQSGLPVDLHNNPTHFPFSTNRSSPLRKNADQHPFDEQPPWQKPFHHHHGDNKDHQESPSKG